jgi:Rps23 Pro-64 3,4-dihydroxylase Tpa1-like proline 4-hydroxylase
VRWELVGPSRHVFYAAMRAGEHFGIHTDTGSEYERTESGAVSCSKFTMLVYLGEDFVGGACQFYDDAFRETVCVRPKRGRVAFFDIDVFHKACPVESGVKTWLGIELVYRRGDAS